MITYRVQSGETPDKIFAGQQPTVLDAFETTAAPRSSPVLTGGTSLSRGRSPSPSADVQPSTQKGKVSP